MSDKPVIWQGERIARLGHRAIPAGSSGVPPSPLQRFDADFRPRLDRLARPIDPIDAERRREITGLPGLNCFQFQGLALVFDRPVHPQCHQ